MKNILQFSIASLLMLVLILSISCKKSQNDEQATPLDLEEGYDINEAKVIMTLAAIAYTAEGNDVQTIKDSITALLKDPSLETKGQWELIWGPGINDDNSNLVYVAKNASTQPASYAMAVRGTSIYSIQDILQDTEVFTLVPFKYGLAGDSVANGSMEGLDILLETEDPVSGKTLSEFLPDITGDKTSKMFITGHSQGGALAPLLSYWFVTTSGVAQYFNLEIYAYAGPSVGNEIFKTNFFNSLPESAYFNMVSNSLDVVPYFWARFDSLVTQHIPASVPLVYRILFTGMKDELQLKNIKYVQLDDQIDIGNFPPVDTLGHIHPSDTLEWYNHWMMEEHRHNNYLKLLGAKPI